MGVNQLLEVSGKYLRSKFKNLIYIYFLLPPFLSFILIVQVIVCYLHIFKYVINWLLKLILLMLMDILAQVHIKACFCLNKCSPTNHVVYWVRWLMLKMEVILVHIDNFIPLFFKIHLFIREGLFIWHNSLGIMRSTALLLEELAHLSIFLTYHLYWLDTLI
jgi:hypothetical protein